MIDLDSLDGIDFAAAALNSSSSSTATPATETTSNSADRRQQLARATQQREQVAPTKSCPIEQQLQQQVEEEEKATTPPQQQMSNKRNTNLLTCMLITANVGTIFEESALLELWFQQLKSYLIKIKPQLVAIHCQEVGGKNYESSMKNVSNFTDKIIGDKSIVCDYSRVKIFLDENFESLEKFTALGSLYLIHNSVDDVKLYNFRTAQYELVVVDGTGGEAGESKDETGAESRPGQEGGEQQEARKKKKDEHVETIKFPKELFPECRWSRKGFMRTRWLFNDCKPLDLVNIHLFHDASNLIAMETTPSPYAQNRQRALEYTLQSLSKPLLGDHHHNHYHHNHHLNSWGQSSQSNESKEDEPSLRDLSQVPLFIFGDFNFRLDTNKVIQRITEGVTPVIKRNSDGNEVLEFHRKASSAQSPVLEANNKQAGEQTKEQQSETEIDQTNATRTATTTTKVNEDGQKLSDDGNSNYITGGGGGGVVMTVGKKLFDCENLDETFRATKNTEWLLELDNELNSFKSKLFEFKISFSPSYPFKEDVSGGYSYMKTRCPAWCDRILFNPAGAKMIYSKKVDRLGDAAAAEQPQEQVGDRGLAGATEMDSEKRIELLQSNGDVVYRLMGNSVPMGDHKPVLLYCQLNLLQNPSKFPASCNADCSAVPAATALATDTLQDDSEVLIESTAM